MRVKKFFEQFPKLVLPAKKSRHQFLTCWMVIQLPWRPRISAYIFFAVFPIAVPTQIVLRTSITSKDANGSSIIYLDTNNTVTCVFIDHLGSFLAIFRNEITTILTYSTSEGGEWERWGWSRFSF